MPHLRLTRFPTRGQRMTDPSDIVERLRDLARFYLNEKPQTPLLQSECEEIAAELSKAAAEIERLRTALAEQKEACARVADAQKERWSALATGHPEGSATRDTLSSYAGIADAIAAAIRAME